MYFSAARATFLGYWSNGLFSGSSITKTSPIIVIVGISENLSKIAVLRFGMKTMSDFSIGAYP